MTLGRSLAIVVLLLSLTGCHAVDNLFCSGAGCEWTKEEWARVQSLSNAGDTKGLGLPEMPASPSNRFLPADPTQTNEDLLELGSEF